MNALISTEEKYGMLWKAAARKEGHKPTPELWPGEHGDGVPHRLLSILAFFKPGKEYTLADVHEVTGMEKTPLAENLRRMFKADLLTRRQIKGNVFAYKRQPRENAK